MTTLSAASTLGDTWNRWSTQHSNSFEPQPMPLDMRCSPLVLATLERPQGKILMVVEDAIMALDLQRMLHEAGYHVVGPATTAPQIQRMIQRGNIDCVILDFDVDRRSPLPIADLLAFVGVPFVLLTTGALGPVPPRHKQRPVVEKPFTREILLAAIEKAMAQRQVANDNRWPTGGPVVPWERVYPPI